jgi:hypothetical protein
MDGEEIRFRMNCLGRNGSSGSAPHPHFVRVSALRARSRSSCPYKLRFLILRLWSEVTLCPFQAKCSVCVIAASDTSDQRSHAVAGTGSAVRPLTPLLVYAGSRLDRSDDRATLDGLKLSRLSPGLDYRPRPLWSFISRSPPGGEVRRSDRCPSPPGFPRVPPHGRSRRIASTLGCPGI